MIRSSSIYVWLHPCREARLWVGSITKTNSPVPLRGAAPLYPVVSCGAMPRDRRAFSLHCLDIARDVDLPRPRDLSNPFLISSVTKTIINPMMHSCPGCQMSWMPRACQPEGIFCRLKRWRVTAFTSARVWWHSGSIRSPRAMAIDRVLCAKPLDLDGWFWQRSFCARVAKKITPSGGLVGSG